MTTANSTTARPTPVQLAFARRHSVEPIRADDPTAQEKLTARIKMLEDTKAAMKAINAALRMKAVVTGNERLRDLGMDDAMIETARQKSPLYESWEFQNLSQNIARLRKRLEQIAAEADRAPAEDVEGDGYRVIENTGLSRIQIVFDAKPDADARTILKRNGFRWAPSQDAWQRHLNNNGRYATKRVLHSLKAA